MEETEFQQRIEELKSLFHEDLIVEAQEAMQTWEKTMSPAQVAAFHAVEEVALLKADIEGAQQALALLGDLESWEMVNDTEEIATFYKGSGDEFFIRGEMIMEQPIFPALALFSEIDLLTTWIKVLKRVDLVSDVTQYRKVLRYALDIPWPCSNRYILISAVGVAIRPNRSALILFRDVTSPSYLGVTMPEPEAGLIRADVPIGCINIMMLESNRTQVSFVAKTNPHLALIPQSLVNYAEKHVVFYLLQMIREKCRTYAGSEYERRVAVKTEYYERLRTRIEKYTS